MQSLLQFLVIIIFLQESLSDEGATTFCGSIRIQEPFLNQDSQLRRMILCKSDKLYFRTSIGLFKISSIDYVKKLLTVDISSCSSASAYVSPNHLSAGFPLPLNPNSLVLLNCSNTISFNKKLSVLCNGTDRLSDRCPNYSGSGHGLASYSSSCLFVGDVGSLGNDFHPETMNCTHYSVVYRRDDDQVLEAGMKISFDVANPCDRCRKPGGDCGAGLRCVCHPKKCKDKVISGAAGLKKKRNGHIVCCLVFVVVVLGIW